MSFKEIMNGSKETTIAGLFAGVALIAGELSDLLDNDPATLFDITVVVAAVGMIVGFLRARDNNKSSEDVGLKKTN